MTADKHEADEVAAALQLAREDRWSPPAPAPLQRPSALIPDYSFQVPPAVAAPRVRYVQPTINTSAEAASSDARPRPEGKVMTARDSETAAAAAEQAAGEALAARPQQPGVGEAPGTRPPELDDAGSWPAGSDDVQYSGQGNRSPRSNQ